MTEYGLERGEKDPGRGVWGCGTSQGQSDTPDVVGRVSLGVALHREESLFHMIPQTCKEVWWGLWVLPESSSAQKCLNFLSDLSLRHRPMHSQSITFSEWPREV